MINESYKNRLKFLAGVISEAEVVLSSDSGRSDKETLGWYSEDYLLVLGSDILTLLDDAVKEEEGLVLNLLKSSTKIDKNSLFINIKIDGSIKEKQIDEEVDLTLTIKFSENSNTVASVSYRGTNNKFNLSSKHSTKDLDTFKSNVVDNIMNSIRLSILNPNS
jgi:hypothetical protein